MNLSTMHANASSSKETACRVCGSVYVPRTAWQVFCSVGCRNRHHNGLRTVEVLAKRVAELEKQVDAIKAHLVL